MESVRSCAKDDDVHQALPSEKLDGTCVYVTKLRDSPWLWARLDRKPAKLAEKKFRKFQAVKRQWEVEGKQDHEPEFVWDPKSDFKTVPACWVHAHGVPVVDGVPQPDENGHIPGWVPVDPTSRQHCWHLTTVDLDQGLALVLQPSTDGGHNLKITIKSLQELEGATMELIGTNVNGNPYHIGSKQQPIHFLVRHGSIPLNSPPPLGLNAMKDWFSKDPEGGVEGVVWHCKNGRLYKVHRHHVGLRWPIENTRLNQMQVYVNVDSTLYEGFSQQLFVTLAELNGQTLQSLAQLPQ